MHVNSPAPMSSIFEMDPVSHRSNVAVVSVLGKCELEAPRTDREVLEGHVATMRAWNWTAFISSLGRRRTLEEICQLEVDDAEQVGPKLYLFDLLCIGVGSTVGSGVLVLSGNVLPVAGPAASLSWLVAGIVCLFTAFSYVELSTRIPTSGSCYIFCLHTFGELSAMLAALCLTLEYSVSGAGVARKFSSLVFSLVGSGSMVWWYVEEESRDSDMYFDSLAGILMGICVIIESSGLNVSKVFFNTMTVAKLWLVGFLIVAGMLASSSNIFASAAVFFPRGASGVAYGSSILFFGFIGFDEVCCLSGRAVNPRDTMPKALGGTLVIAALLSCAAQAAIAMAAGPVHGATSWPEVFEARGWTVAKLITSAGEVMVLPLVVLLSFLPQPELLGAMGRDGVLPRKFGHKDEQGKYRLGSLVSGVLSVLMAAVVPFNIMWGTISLGVLVSFNLTNSALLMLRYGGRRFEMTYFLGILWLTGAVGSESLWRGVVEPAFTGTSVSFICLVVCVLSFAACACVTVAMSRLTGEIPLIAEGTFLAPCVPFLQSASIVFNFIMMATTSWTDHVCFFVFVFVFMSLFLSCRLVGNSWIDSKKGCCEMPCEHLCKDQEASCSR